jgi:hypothetical protein
MKFWKGWGSKMPSPEVWVYLALIPALIALYFSWFFYRRFTKTGEFKNLLWSQLCAFPAAFLFVRLLEAVGVVAGKAADYLYLAMGVLIFAAGIFLRQRVRPLPKKKTPGRTAAGKKANSAGKGSAGKKAGAKKRKGR